MKGYPIGFLLLWDSPSDPKKSIQIGETTHTFDSPKYLIIDGQQRLTSLYAVMRGVEILDRKFQKHPIAISYNPLTNEFKVADNATKRSYEWIHNISDTFKNKNNGFTYINSFITNLEAARVKSEATLSDKEKQIISNNITSVMQLAYYIIPALEINEEADEESIADIFVRVNSGGEKLNENDFILTLISVYWQEGRQKIERFCYDATIPAKNTSYNHLFEPKPSHIIRTTMSFGFKRARLKYAYMLLRGRDFEKGKYSDNLRIQKFEELKPVIDKVLNLQNWHDFIKCLESAGYISSKLISSDNTLTYVYAMYLIGKYDFKIKEIALRKLIAKWFFMCSVSGYYTNSPESRMEQDLADLRAIHDEAEFTDYIQNQINAVFTNDYFTITLTGNNGLASSSANSPAWYGYCAALNILDAKGLFSNLHTRELFSFPSSGIKSALEKHHLFPKAYLESIGITDDRERNQIANFAFIEWIDNIKISDDNPSIYFPKRMENISAEEKDQMYFVHALPQNWGTKDYDDFLVERRKLMAHVIKKGYEKIC